MTDSLEPEWGRYLLRFPVYGVAVSNRPLGEEISPDDPNIAFAKVERDREDGGRDEGVLIFTELDYATQFAGSLPAGHYAAMVPLDDAIDLGRLLQQEASRGATDVVFDASPPATPKQFCSIQEVLDALRKAR